MIMYFEDLVILMGSLALRVIKICLSKFYLEITLFICTTKWHIFLDLYKIDGKENYQVKNMFKTILLAFFIVTALTVRTNVDNSVKHLEYRPEDKDWNTQDVRTGSGTQRVPSAATPQAFPRYSEPIPYTPTSGKQPSS